MSVYAALSEEECYLWAILSDPSGIDQMEFMIHDSAYKIQEKDGSVTQGLFRAWPFQVAWWRDRNPLVISQGSRSAGKSLSCCAAALAFPFCYPGEEMVITAPENVHLQALTDKIETMYVNNRVPKEMLVRGVHGIKHKPYLQNFSNGARIMGRIPQRDGRGVKGVHPAVLLLDEASDYPELAWNELIETVNQSSENAQWKAFGVTRGVRDKFYEYTTSDNWKVYRLPAMFRPTWSDEERAAKVAQYGSEDNVDYRRNILGVHSDAASPLFSAMQLGRCFIGVTSVHVHKDEENHCLFDVIPISDVSIGDVVLNAVGSGTVINKIASEHDEIYEIRVQGESIYGTGDHPVFTRRGWVPIRDLTTDDEIVTADGLSQLWEGLLDKEGEQEVLLKSLYG